MSLTGNSIFQTIRESLDAGKKGMLATVILRTGSAPRDVGARMFVREDGTSYGTVGGGLLEKDVQAEALERKGTDEAGIVHVRMDAKTIQDQGMICGGNVDVLLEPVASKHRDLYARLAEMEQKSRRGVIVTSLGDTPRKTLVEENLAITGDPMDSEMASQFLACLRWGRPVITDDKKFLIEPVSNRTPLYVFGAGHVSQYIAKIADIVDFSVTVIDDRQEFANPERFPEAKEIMVNNVAGAFAELPFTGSEYVVIVTRGHSNDAEVLENALAKKTRYVGMIGSRRKVSMIFDLMRQSGFSEDDISRIHAPIGLSIHAETPQEIAVSIVGQLIQIRGE
jgi:xanthine dehydrogenase accessory factor